MFDIQELAVKEKEFEENKFMFGLTWFGLGVMLVATLNLLFLYLIGFFH